MESGPANTRRAARGRRAGVAGVGLAVLVVAAALVAGVLPMLPGGGGVDGASARAAAAAVIFIGSYLGLAIGRVPGLAVDRAGIALVGAGLMVAAGVLSPQAAFAAIDLDTIALLLGMMILVASLRLSGFFPLLAGWCARRARRPVGLLAMVVAASGVLSAFLVNDAICLVLAPLVLELARRLERDPKPYLLAVAMASNVGSVATITGNPQNMMIGSLSGISYGRFAAALSPVALVGLGLTVLLLWALYRREFAAPLARVVPAVVVRVRPALLGRAWVAGVAMVAGFFAGVRPSKVAIIVGGLLLLTRRVKSRRVYAEIDWSLLLMFAGLFVIVAGAQRALLGPGEIAAVGRLRLDLVPVLAGVSAVASNLVSNVPAVLLLRPFVAGLANHDLAWLTVAMASTLAGNLTLLGSVANLIVVQRAAAGGVAIGFWEYGRVGLPLGLLTLLFGTLWLMG